MKTFINADFLLYSETARELYHDTAKDLPIIDYHNHLLDKEILNDKNYDNLSEIWLGGDHYKWRAMRANGISEDYITGDKSDYEKFLAWSKTVPQTIGNPLYHWTHLELLRYFSIDDILNEETAPAIWKEANQKLATPELSVRSILKKYKVEFLGTTDDPTDDLANHRQLHREGFTSNVTPSFRPDKGLKIENGEFTKWIQKLEQATNIAIEDYKSFIDALMDRVAFFVKHGCRSSDHGIDAMFYEEASEQEVANIFKKRFNGEVLNAREVDQFKTHTLIVLGELYAENNWGMQLHLGALRNNNKRMFHRLGADTGFDSVGDLQI